MVSAAAPARATAGGRRRPHRRGWSMLDVKLMRDLARLWPQSLAVALVMACGVMTLILALGAWRSLTLTRDAYYDRYLFGHVFASARRVPAHLAARIHEIPGVAAVGARIRTTARVELPDLDEPANAVVQSLPAHGRAAVGRLYVRAGRLPEPGRRDEVAVEERFAAAHGLRPGDRLPLVIAGHRIEPRITAIVLSPEFIYLPDPASFMPDDARYTVVFLRAPVLEALLDMGGAFNSLAVRLARGADERRVIARIDALLAPWGGLGAKGRDKHESNAFLDSELQQLERMAETLPPIFLGVAAFLVNMILGRLVALEREQIGLLKAMGFSDLAVGRHYARFVLAVSLVGIAIGSGLGAWLGRLLTRLYGEYYRFPFLIFRESWDLYAIAAAITLAAGLAGAARSIAAAVRLPPAVAMRPPAPARFRHLFAPGGGLDRLGRALSRLTMMALRGMVHRPLRTVMTAFAVATAVALLVSAMAMLDSAWYMIDETFYRASRADARVALSKAQAPGAIHELARLPGVRAAEPVRALDVILRHGPREARVGLTGHPARPALDRVIDERGRPVPMPPRGVLLTRWLADKLEARPGDVLEVEIVPEGHRRARLRVAGVIEGWLGLGAHASLETLARISREGPRITGAALSIDRRERRALMDAVRARPGVAGIALQDRTRARIREMMDQNLGIMVGVYVTIAVVVTFGVIYNAARIQLSERGRELASLRVLGFTRMEVYRVLLVELVLITLLAQPLGWLLGWALAGAMIKGFASDLFQFPFVVSRATFGFGSAVVMAAALVSAAVVGRRVARLDLIAVLKTRE